MTASHHPAPLDRLDPRIRVAGAMALTLTIALVEEWPALAGGALVALALARLAGLGPRDLWQRLRHAERLVVVLVLLLPLTVPGTPVLTVLGLSVSAPGLERAAVLLVKINACLVVVFALVGTLEPSRIGKALAGLGAPERLVHLLLFVVRYLDLVRRDLMTLHEAMRVRGFRARATRHGWRSLAQVAGTALVRGLERAERVSEAMCCRGFTCRLPRSPRPPLATGDHLAALAFAATAIALLTMDLAR